MNATARTPLAEDPPDLATMRETAHRMLGPDSAPDVLPPSGEELETLTATLRGQIELLAPEVEQAATLLSESSPTRAAALACAEEAGGKLRAHELSFVPLAGSAMYARRLARVLAALCDHYEIVSAGIEVTSEQMAFVRLANHCAGCKTCLARNSEGVNAELSCEEESRLYEVYRAACARASAARLAGRRPAEASA
ncbi:DUF6415 family natural product biosynthesis protein [Streptomyces sp. NPDC008137]|uniref:DUF6415 family natural product biosynthesis protein n=1 Tax=Streptomyces sp. NPDC008137 TaxID=3364813 RepID=UPI0036E4427D